jgi:hypothetical protein
MASLGVTPTALSKTLRHFKETKAFWYNRLMGTIRVGEVRFRVWSHDHAPRHVHAFLGSGFAVLVLEADGTVLVREEIGLTRSELRKTIAAAVSAFDRLVALWEKTHGN